MKQESALLIIILNLQAASEFLKVRRRLCKRNLHHIIQGKMQEIIQEIIQGKMQAIMQVIMRVIMQ